MNPRTEEQGEMQSWAMKIDHWAKFIVPTIFLLECATLLTWGLSNDEYLNDMPNHEVHYLKSVKFMI